VYRWNRPVYAADDGLPHLRVENRVLRLLPTVADMMANAAFYYGLVRALAEQERPVWTRMLPAAARDNLTEGARDGIDARLFWPGLGEVPVTELVLRHLAAAGPPWSGPLGGGPGGHRPAAGHHRAALPDRAERRDLAGRRGPRAGGVPRPGPDRGAARDDPLLPGAHALQRAGAQLARDVTRAAVAQGPAPQPRRCREDHPSDVVNVT
jgi:hypothetical protein